MSEKSPKIKYGLTRKILIMLSQIDQLAHICACTLLTRKTLRMQDSFVMLCGQRRGLGSAVRKCIKGEGKGHVIKNKEQRKFQSLSDNLLNVSPIHILY